jgi:hypothetical protein
LMTKTNLSLENVLKCNVYCTSVEKFAAVNAIYSRSLAAELVARRVDLIAASGGDLAAHAVRPFVVAGGLMSYGTNAVAMYRQIGVYAGRVLKGEKPSNLPVMQPTQFDLLINLTAAKAIGLTIPESFLLRADEVIE